MADVDHAFKLVVQGTGRLLPRVAGLKVDRWQQLESTLPATVELIADRTFLASQGRERFVAYIEAYTTWRREALWSLLAKSGFLSLRETLPTVCLVFILRKRGYRPQQGQFRLEAAGGPTQHLWFREVCLWEVQPEDWWETTPELMALYPLCRHGGPPRAAVKHAAAVIQARVHEPTARADRLALLDIFGELAYPGLDVANVIGRELMKGSRFFQEVREEGRQEGMLLKQQESILEILEARFGPEARAGVAETVQALTVPEQLRRLLRLAATCDTPEMFREALPTPSS